MAIWQRRVRLLVAVAAVAFAIVVVVAFRPRAPEPVPAAPLPPSDPEAIVESASGTTIRVNREEEEVRVEYEQLLSYPDGTTRMMGMRVTTVRAGGRTFLLTGKEGTAAPNATGFEVTGDVELASDDLRVRAGEATYSEDDGLVRVPGRVTFREGRVSGTSRGMTYDSALDTVTLADQVDIRVAPEEGNDGLQIRAGYAELMRASGIVQFDDGVEAEDAVQRLRAAQATGYLDSEGERLERLELRDGAQILARRPEPGGLRELRGPQMDLEYAPDGRSLRQVAVRGGAVMLLAAARNAEARRISADRLDVVLGQDGQTPVDLRAAGDVHVAFPGPKGTALRTVRAARLVASSEGGSELTAARFSGSVVFEEEGAGFRRVARSDTLDAALAPGLGELQTARFGGGVRFEDGDLTALGENAAYQVESGELELRAAAGSAVPRIVDVRLAVEAREIDVTLEGPRVRARGAVKSELLPDPEDTSRKVPSMLRRDQPVIVVADEFDYDRPESTAVYKGSVRLSQGDTSIKGAAMTLDEGNGDLEAAGDVVTTTVLRHTTADGSLERVPSIARASQFAFSEAEQRATYTGDAQVGGPHGEMRASRVELYLRPGGTDELERVEAYENVALLEQRRRTTGTRLTYFSEDNRYLVAGTPVRVVDDCGRETIGRTLVFHQDTDRVVVDGNEQIRTRTTGASACP